MPEHEYPPGMKESALFVAMYRVEANRDRYDGNPEKQRTGQVNSVVFGSISRELWTDAVGILGEMLVRSQVELSGRHDHYTAGCFISPRPNDGADLIVGGNNIAIKANEDGVPRVNDKAHLRGDCTHYAFVHLQANGYDLKYYTRKQVENWRVIDGRFSSYRTP